MTLSHILSNYIPNILHFRCRMSYQLNAIGVFLVQLTRQYSTTVDILGQNSLSVKHYIYLYKFSYFPGLENLTFICPHRKHKLVNIFVEICLSLLCMGVFLYKARCHGRLKNSWLIDMSQGCLRQPTSPNNRVNRDLTSLNL